MKRSCGTCQFWDHAAGRLPNGRLRPRAYVACQWTFPDIALPSSVPAGRGTGFIKPTPHHMPHDGGGNCPVWKER